MRKNLLLLAACTTLLFSCGKDDSATPGNTDNSKLIGTWTFVNMKAHTYASQTQVSGSDTYKSITISDYVTKNNGGGIVITADSLKNDGFMYSVDTIAIGLSYINGVLEDSISAPFQFTAPVTSGSVAYKMITSDSLYSAAGTVTIGGTTTPSVPAGMKIGWSADTLLMTSTATQNTTTTVDGVKMTIYETSTQTMKYVKKK